MKTKKIILRVIALAFLVATIGFISNNNADLNSNSKLTIQQVALDGNNIKSFIWDSGILNQNLININQPGFEWPKGTGHFAVFSTGLTLAAYVNNQIRMAVAAWNGEYSPGYCINGTYQTNSNFRFFIIRRGDNPATPDWANWGLMVPYGAPYIDVNQNNTYEAAIDTPGVRSASETIFICLTDANPASHINNTGFGGNTQPLGAEVHLTAWCYDNPAYQDMQFLKWVVINKSSNPWDSLYTTIFNDPDLGYASDDYIGCDTTRELAYCYNAYNNDYGNSYSYGLNPPAVGFMFLNCAGTNIHMSAVNFINGYGVTCELDPSSGSEVEKQAYWFMKGFKKDGTPYVVPNTNPPVKTKYNYSGDPETGSGWTEFTGKVNNCGGLLTGTLVSPAAPSDRRLLLHTGPINRLNTGDTEVVQICQLIARGSSNLNSVTKLKQLSDVAKNLCETGFVIGVTPVSSQVPNTFELYQNYPNPFNPITKIKFDIPNGISNKGLLQGSPYGTTLVQIKVYDALGREVETLVNEQLKPGTYETQWDASNYPSGVYFYKLEMSDYTQTRKLVLLK